MKTQLLCIVLFTAPAIGLAAEPDVVLDVWPGKPPGEMKEIGPEKAETVTDVKTIIRVSNVSKPTISVYKPENPNGAAVVICPGGGYHILAWDLEGTEVAEWLNENGVTGIVLKYRVPRRDKLTFWKPPLQDAQRAMSLVRSKADEWGLDPERIGVLGFSAGGNLTVRTATQFGERMYESIDEVDEVSCRPDFALPIYAAYLSGEDALSAKSTLNVPEDTPPMFMVHTFDDGRDGKRASTHVNGVMMFGMALRDADVPFEMHVFPTGGHGYGLRPSEHAVTGWPKLAEVWMQKNGVIPEAE
ncbi:alpha/beta hydrolase [Stratiformator vulcanicus]|uniref:Acetylxylan esterase n=1 Tax=Stratiformator vulcanicus TaxID=2527980 RepID=A0A517QW38_9PLAN|nr:alpha/beta hydrolase [Stratiformator vulcanicus]QDT35824.1 Acetylxylan esterase precursor [Stratiformator vulcanicus]